MQFWNHLSHERVLQDSAQTIEDPFDHAQGQVLSTENRASQTKRTGIKAVTSTKITRPDLKDSQKKKR
jgi:hypothetical protein